MKTQKNKLAERPVSHKGKVIEVSSESVTVEILSKSACSACHAAGMCSMSEVAKKHISVPAGREIYSLGEEVEVLLLPSMGMKAVFYAYVIPLLILVILCVSLCVAGISELYAGLAGLIGIVIYYLVIYSIRGRFAREYVFEIRKIKKINL